MPTRAQDQVRRGPLGALLILLSLFLTSGTATAAESELRESAARFGATRQSAAAAVLPPATRNPLEDQASGDGDGPSLAASAASLVTESLWARPLGDSPFQRRAHEGRHGGAPYRARAPPAA